MKQTVIAQAEKHQELIDDGWKPVRAYQEFEHTTLFKDGQFRGNELKAITKLYIVMEKEDKNVE